MITVDEANNVWTTLVQHAGASASDIERISFVAYAAGRDEVSEYRFRGKLGFGGKVRKLGGGYWHVYYYPEDRNEAREAIRHQTNEALAAIQNQESNRNDHQ